MCFYSKVMIVSFYSCNMGCLICTPIARDKSRRLHLCSTSCTGKLSRNLEDLCFKPLKSNVFGILRGTSYRDYGVKQTVFVSKLIMDDLPKILMKKTFDSFKQWPNVLTNNCGYKNVYLTQKEYQYMQLLYSILPLDKVRPHYWCSEPPLYLLFAQSHFVWLRDAPSTKMSYLISYRHSWQSEQLSFSDYVGVQLQTDAHPQPIS